MNEELRKLQDKVETLMRENEVYGYELDFDLNNNRRVDIEIFNGDWKHDHLRLKWIMEDNNFIQIGEDVTEDDGSDCYSAIHVFLYCGE